MKTVISFKRVGVDPCTERIFRLVIGAAQCFIPEDSHILIENDYKTVEDFVYELCDCSDCQKGTVGGHADLDNWTIRISYQFIKRMGLTGGIAPKGAILKVIDRSKRFT